MEATPEEILALQTAAWDAATALADALYTLAWSGGAREAAICALFVGQDMINLKHPRYKLMAERQG